MRGAAAVVATCVLGAPVRADVEPAPEPGPPTGPTTPAQARADLYLEESIWAGALGNRDWTGPTGGLRVAGGIRLHACRDGDGADLRLGLDLDLGIFGDVSPGAEAQLDGPIGGGWRLGARLAIATNIPHGGTTLHLVDEMIGLRARSGHLVLGLDVGRGTSPERFDRYTSAPVYGAMIGVGGDGDWVNHRVATYALYGLLGLAVIGGAWGTLYAIAGPST